MHAFDNLLSVINLYFLEQPWNEKYGCISSSGITTHVLQGVITKQFVIQIPVLLLQGKLSLRPIFFFFFVCKMEDCLFIHLLE